MEPDEAPLGKLGFVDGEEGESDRGEKGLESGGGEMDYLDILVI